MGLPAGRGVLQAGGQRARVGAPNFPPHGPLPLGRHDPVSGQSLLTPRQYFLSPITDHDASSIHSNVKLHLSTSPEPFFATAATLAHADRQALLWTPGAPHDREKKKKTLRCEAFQPCYEAWLMGGLE